LFQYLLFFAATSADQKYIQCAVFYYQY